MSLSASLRPQSSHIRTFNLRNIRRTDPWLALCVIALAAIGIMVLYSASRSATASTPFYYKQSIFFLGGCGVALFISCLDHRFIVSMGPVFYVVFGIVTIALLLTMPFN